MTIESREPSSVSIRDACEADAPQLLGLHLAMERRFDLLYEPGERPDDPQLVRAAIADFARRSNCRFLVAEEQGELLGWLTLEGGRQRRRAKSAYLIMSVRPDCQGRGIGSALLRTALAWAQQAGLLRVELVVLKSNPAAQRLYTRHGFQEEGLLRQYVVVHGAPVDAVMMARLFQPP